MKRIQVNVASFLIILVIAVLFLGNVYWYHCYQKEKGETTIVEDTESDVKLPTETEKRTVTIDEVEVMLAEIGELSTYSGQYEITREEGSSRYVLENIKVLGTTNTIHLECEGIVKVGYDLDDIGVNIDNESQTIYISLPKATVKDNYVIWDTVSCVEENSILHPIEFDQYQTLIEEIEAEGLSQAETEGIYADAQSNLENIITNFLSGIDGYTVEFL